MNAKDTPIVILGFGRSGTTWVSDILSKCLGGLILFEPFHPAVCDFSSDICYAPDVHAEQIGSHWNHLRNKRNRNRWLLRNHLNSPLDAINPSFIDFVWEQSQILGYKAIRLNHSIKSVSSIHTVKPIFIVRHPLSVISSILKRPRFWEEYGWENHWKNFSEKTLITPCFSVSQLTALQKIKQVCDTYEQKIAFLWSVSTSISLTDLKNLQFSPFYYEDLYLSPYEETLKLLDYIERPSQGIHPSYLFTPSMMTLRTTHDLNIFNSDLSFFWKNDLSPLQVKNINLVIESVCKINDSLYQLCADRHYLKI